MKRPAKPRKRASNPIKNVKRSGTPGPADAGRPGVGLESSIERVIPREWTIAAFDPNLPAVLSTPAMAGMMEIAAAQAVRGELPPGAITVGTRIEVDHLKPATEGATVRLAQQALMLRRSSWRSHVVSIDELSANEETAMPLQIPDSRPNPERSYSQREQRRILYRAMNDLTPGIRAALEIREIGEQSVRETAQVLGVSIPAVKSRVNRGRRILREKLERRMAFKNTVPARQVQPAA
jgi:RNA polymerase sigma factor (sigma-70 family)